MEPEYNLKVCTKNIIPIFEKRKTNMIIKFPQKGNLYESHSSTSAVQPAAFTLRVSNKET